MQFIDQAECVGATDMGSGVYRTASGKEYDVYTTIGVDVTERSVPMFRNIDPQDHGGLPHAIDPQGDMGFWEPEELSHGLAACDYWDKVHWIPETWILGRHDLDAFTCIAGIILANNGADYQLAEDIAHKCAIVSKADRFEQSPIWEPYSLDSEGWPPSGNVSDAKKLAAISAACQDYSVPVMDRINAVRDWFILDKIAEKYTVDRSALLHVVPEYVGAGVCELHTSCQGAFSLGYSLAPVVVVYNDAHRWGNGTVTPKFTIGSWSQKYLNHEKLRQALGKGWGGSGSITGSPFNTDPGKTPREVFNLVFKLANEGY